MCARMTREEPPQGARVWVRSDAANNSMMVAYSAPHFASRVL
jgi:hypothetical protein